MTHKTLKTLTLLLSGLLVAAAPAQAQVSFGVSLPGLQIGINMPTYPRLIRVPGYPVYYDPQADNNYFFYDGLYWVFRDDDWYQSSWYNGPWQAVPPDSVPLFVLRVPVRYYRQPPPFFRGWQADAAPRWGEHFGSGWQQQHNNWDRWDRKRMPAAAPLPTYQRNFRGEQYPQGAEQQQAVRDQHYRYNGHEGQQPPSGPPARGPAPAQPLRMEPPHPQAPPPGQMQAAPHAQPQPHTQAAAPERPAPAAGPGNNPGQGRGADRGGQDRGPERGGPPDRGGQPGRGERPERPEREPR
jgi:hypothetical protein